MAPHSMAVLGGGYDIVNERDGADWVYVKGTKHIRGMVC